MKHPLFKQPAMLIWYYVFWVISAVVHFFIEVRVFDANTALSLVDVLVSYLLSRCWDWAFGM